jgi:adenylate kinase
VVEEASVKINVFLGAPGSGKGTQAKRLAESHGFKHFSTGDMLRAALQAGTAVGKKAKTFVDKGELVPDPVMIELIETALSPLGPKASVILDGFPRTVPQAEALDADPKTAVSKAIYFSIPEQVLVGRLTGRRICEKCGEPYHVLFMPPKREGICDRDGGKLFQRTDDSESVVQRRLEVFRGQNEQLLEYYRGQHKLAKLEADRPVDEVQAELIRLLS